MRQTSGKMSNTPSSEVRRVKIIVENLSREGGDNRERERRTGFRLCAARCCYHNKERCQKNFAVTFTIFFGGAYNSLFSCFCWKLGTFSKYCVLRNFVDSFISCLSAKPTLTVCPVDASHLHYCSPGKVSWSRRGLTRPTRSATSPGRWRSATAGRRGTRWPWPWWSWRQWCLVLWNDSSVSQSQTLDTIKTLC